MISLSSRFFSLIFPTLCLVLYVVPARANALRPDDVLSLRDGDFYLDGKPYAEMSFNKFDLLWEIWDGVKSGDPIQLKQAAARQNSALRDLHEQGFRTIRIFGAPWGEMTSVWTDEAKRQKLFQAIDTVLDLCEKNQMQVVFSLNLGGFAGGGDAIHPSPLYWNEDSPNRQLCYAYLDAVVGRYKERKAIAMWEISNELTDIVDIGVRGGKASPSLPQMAAFLDQAASRIKRDDPLRLVSTGGSTLRTSAWHLWHGGGWAPDTQEQYKEAYEAYFANSAIDVIDSHLYEQFRDGGTKLAGGSSAMVSLAWYANLARSLGKGGIVGECAMLPFGWDNKQNDDRSDWFQGYHDANAAPWVQKGIDELIQSRTPIAYWWAYQSDRAMDEKQNPVTFSLETTPDLVRMIANGNRHLKALRESQQWNVRLP